MATMEFPEAKRIIKKRLKREGHDLSPIEEVALEAAWNGIKYKKISELRGVNFNSLQSAAAPRLWKKLSEIYSSRITKASFKSFCTEILPSKSTEVLQVEKPAISEQIEKPVISDIEPAISNIEPVISDIKAVISTQPPAISIPVVGATLPYPENFYGRQKELRELAVLIDKYPCLLIVGAEGIGKKTLVAQFLRDAVLPFSQIIWKPLHHRPQNLEAELLQLLKQEDGSSLISYFRDHKSLIVFESLDALITRQGEQSELDHNIMSLIRRITEETESKVIGLSNEPIEQISSMKLRGNAAVCPLRGLGLQEAEALMGGDLAGHLKGIWKFTGGNPLMLKQISQWQQTQAAASLGTMVHRLTVHQGLSGSLVNQILAKQSLSKIDRQLLEFIASQGTGISYRQLLHLYPEAAYNIQRLLEMGLVDQTPSISGDIIVQVYEFLRQHLLAQQALLSPA